MSRTPAAELARIKVNHPTWRIRATDEGFEAVRDGAQIQAATLTELEASLQRPA